MPADATPALKPLEISALVVLMSEARELTNNELAALAGFRIDGEPRRRLVGLGLVDSRKVGRAYAFRLSEAGWRRCGELLAGPAPRVPGPAGRSLFVLLAGVRRALGQRDLGAAEFFGRDTVVRATTARGPSAREVDSAIRAAYARLADAPGAWVGLADLRDELSGVSRGELDLGLRRLLHVPGVSLIPVAMLTALERRDRAAAIMIGDQANHALRIETA
jgi:hypothetical protein